MCGACLTCIKTSHNSLSAASAFKFQHGILFACNFKFNKVFTSIRNMSDSDSCLTARHFKMIAYVYTYMTYRLCYTCMNIVCVCVCDKIAELHSHKIQFNVNLNQFRGIKIFLSPEIVLSLVRRKIHSVHTVPWFEFCS